MYLGEFDIGVIIDFKFTSRAFTTGTPFTLAGSPAISVYKSNSTTESTSGCTITADFDSRPGLNHVRIDLSSDGTFYAIANDFDVVITSGTVNSVSVVGEVVAHFSTRNRASLYPATAARTLVVDAAGLADANMVKAGPSGSGTAQTARDIGGALPAFAPNANGGLPILSSSGTTLAYTISTLTTYTGNTPQTGDAYAIVNNGTYGNYALNTAIGLCAKTTDLLTSAQIVAAIWTDTTPGNYTVPNSPGFQVFNFALSGAANNAIADAVLTRDWTATIASVGQPASRSSMNALRKLRNKIDTTSIPGFLRITREDDSTLAYSQPIIVSPSAQLLTSVG